MKREKTTRERLWEETSGHCVYCGHPVSLEQMEVDHIVPRSLGGDNSFDNKVCACPQCNAAKGNLLVEDYLEKAMSQKKLRHYRNRLDTLVEQFKISEEKAELLYPVEEEPSPFGLTEWQTRCMLADILIGNLSAIMKYYGRQEEKQYFQYY